MSRNPYWRRLTVPQEAVRFGLWERFILTLYLLVLQAFVLTTAVFLVTEFGDPGDEFAWAAEMMMYFFLGLVFLAFWGRPFLYGLVDLGRRGYERWVKA